LVYDVLTIVPLYFLKMYKTLSSLTSFANSSGIVLTRSGSLWQEMAHFSLGLLVTISHTPMWLVLWQ